MNRNAWRTAIVVLLASLGLITGCSHLGAQGRSMDSTDQTLSQDLQGGPN